MTPGFFLSLIFILLLQVGLQYVLTMLSFSNLWICIIIDFVLAVVFTLFNFRGREKLRNPSFHQSVAVYFLILSIFSLIFGQYW